MVEDVGRDWILGLSQGCVICWVDGKLLEYSEQRRGSLMFSRDCSGCFVEETVGV